VYLRPDVVVVYDRLASSTPRQWEWNIHALNQMEGSGKNIIIRNGGQSLCVDMLAGPPLEFSQTNEWTAAPRSGAEQWHGKFATQPLPAAQLIALLRIGCKEVTSQVASSAGGWKLTVGQKTIAFSESGEASVR
jgi:hypothetical protein